MAKKIRGFAHLFGFSANSSENDEDEKEKSKKAKGRRAEEDENGEDDEQDDKENSKKSKRAEEDDDDAGADDGDDEDDHDVKKSRHAERNRISRILGSKYAAGKGPLAVSLAINTGMSSAAAIRVLASSGPMQAPQQPRRLSLDERMSKVENHQLGHDDVVLSGNANTVVTRAAALYNQVKGKK
ncbi:DNA primase [Pectobacterium polaris]|uniref:DNA primase n=1 Tax=Pectobacterium polaris TaxID=2042057 RepID=UPI000D61FEBB|nr:DNA primase [Pectobacterium polaris]MCU1787748.1 DNA primase [Pectobacterium polaris]PWD57062.1 DNA primase [Pectobacterium polaris]